MISAQGLTKKFGSVLAIDNASFTVASGEFVFLIGKSGSGKTTLIRLLLRDLKPDSGTLIIDESDVAKISSGKLSMFRRGIGVIFQDYKLLMDRNVWENVALPLQLRQVKQAEAHVAVQAALETVGLADKMELFPAQLSGGEIQRVAIARAIVAQPKLILADEPTGNLDPATAKSILKLLRQIHEELQTTVIMATHNADLVDRSSLRVITLESGKLIKDTQKGKYE